MYEDRLRLRNNQFITKKEKKNNNITGSVNDYIKKNKHIP